MARLWHTGAETGEFTADGIATVTNAATFSTTVARTGSYSYKYDGAAGATAQHRVNFTGALDRRVFVSCWCYVPSGTGLPGSDIEILRIRNTSSQVLVAARLLSTGKVALYEKSTTQIGSDSAATIATDTWFHIALATEITTGTTDFAELQLNGVSVASSSSRDLFDIAPGNIIMGWGTNPGAGKILYIDDLIINDETGTNNNSWPLDEKVVLLLPTSDNARTGWTGGAGGTTNLYDALNNIPPVGVDGASATNTSQIIDGNNNNTDTYAANMTTYTAAGIGSADQITAVYALEMGGNSSTTGTDTVGLQVTSNPAISEASPSIDANDGTYPTGWLRGATSILENPVVAKGTAPVVRIRKGVVTTRVAGCCFMGMYVSYLPEQITAAAGDTFVNEAFTDTSNTLLETHDANWVNIGGAIVGVGSEDSLRISNANRVRSDAAHGNAWAQYSNHHAPTSAEYDVRADVRVITNEASGAVGVQGRCDDAATGFYLFYYDQASTSWKLTINGIPQASAPHTLSASTTYAIELRIRNSAIAGYVDGQQVTYFATAFLTNAEYAGAFIASLAGNDATGYHLDNFVAQDVVTTPGGGSAIRYRAIIGLLLLSVGLTPLLLEWVVLLSGGR